MKYYTLSNGFTIPGICFGTDIVPKSYFSNEKLGCFCRQRAVQIKSIFSGNYSKYKKNMGIINCTNNAIKHGCNLFDTSRAYSGSEKMLSLALKHASRKDYFICTKLCNKHQLQGIPARKALEESLENLGLEYVDIYLLHWPVEGLYLDYWKQLEGLYHEGLCKAIGVSNCKIHHLQEIEKIATIMPMINEFECHPLLSERELRAFCSQKGIQPMAYTSTARLDFRLKRSKRLQMVCERNNKNLSQVILRWHIQNGVIPIFNTSSNKHFETNMDVFDFELSDDDMRIIDSININSRTRYDSDNCEWDRL